MKDDQEVSQSSLDQMVDRSAGPTIAPKERYSVNHLGSPVALKPKEVEDAPPPRSWAMRQIDAAVREDLLPGKTESIDRFGLRLAQRNNFVLKALSRKISRQLEMTLPKQSTLRKLELDRQAQIMRTVSANAALGQYQFQRTQMLPFMRKTVALSYQKVSILKQVVTSITKMEKAVVSKLEAIKLNTGASAPAKLSFFKQWQLAHRERSVNRIATNTSNFVMDGYESLYRDHVTPRAARLYNKLAIPGKDGGLNAVASAATDKVNKLKTYMSSVANKDQPQTPFNKVTQSAARVTGSALDMVAKLGQRARLSESKNAAITDFIKPTAERASVTNPFARIFPHPHDSDSLPQSPGSSTGFLRHFKLFREESKTYFTKSLDYLSSISAALNADKDKNRLRRPYKKPGDKRQMHPRDSSEVKPNLDLNTSSRNILSAMSEKFGVTAPVEEMSHHLSNQTKSVKRAARYHSLVASRKLKGIKLPSFSLWGAKAKSGLDAVRSVDLATAAMIAGTGATLAQNRLERSKNGVIHHITDGIGKAKAKLSPVRDGVSALRSVDLATVQMIAGTGAALASKKVAKSDWGQKVSESYSNTKTHLKERAQKIQAERQARKDASAARKAARLAQGKKSVSERISESVKTRAGSYADIHERANALRTATVAKVAGAGAALGSLGRRKPKDDDADTPPTDNSQPMWKTGLIGGAGAAAIGIGKRFLGSAFRGGWGATKWAAGKGLKFAPKGLGLAARGGAAGAGILGRFAARESAGAGRLGLRVFKGGVRGTANGIFGAAGGIARGATPMMKGLGRFGGPRLLRFAKSPLGIGLAAGIGNEILQSSGATKAQKKVGGTALDIVSYGSTGAMLGTMIAGPVGTVIGGLAGATYGLVSNNMESVFGQDAIVDTDGHVLRQRKGSGSLFGNLKIAMFGRKAEYSKSGELIAPAENSLFGKIAAAFTGGVGPDGKPRTLSDKFKNWVDGIPGRAKDEAKSIGDKFKDAWKDVKQNAIDQKNGIVNRFKDTYNYWDNMFQGDKTVVVPGTSGKAPSSAEVKNMAERAIPGIRVTSTDRSMAHNAKIGGSKNSWHTKGRAIDFVPPGGMGSMTKAQVRQKFQAMGLNVIEVLGPGDRGHNDHFHVAWGDGPGVGGGASNGGYTPSNDNGTGFFTKNDYGNNNNSGANGKAPSATRASAKMVAGNVGKQPEYIAAYKKLPPELRKAVDKSPQLRFVLWSSAVQHGPDNASSIFQKNYNPALDEKAFTKSIYDDRATRFTNLSEGDRATAISKLSGEQNFTENFRNGFNPTRQQFQTQLTGMITPDNYLPTGDISGSKGQRAKMAYQFFKNRGYSDIAATGIVANLMGESQVSANPPGSNDGGRAAGVAQWHPDRQAAIQRQFGKNVREMNLMEQLAAVDWEIKNGIAGRGRGLFNKFNAAQSIDEAVRIGVEEYEISGNQARDKAVRSGYARELVRAIGNQPTKTPAKPQSVPSSSTPSPSNRTPAQPGQKTPTKPQTPTAAPPLSKESENQWIKALRENTAAMSQNRGNTVVQNNTNISPFLNKPGKENFVTMSMKKAKLAAGDY